MSATVAHMNGADAAIPVEDTRLTDRLRHVNKSEMEAEKADPNDNWTQFTVAIGDTEKGRAVLMFCILRDLEKQHGLRFCFVTTDQCKINIC